MILIVGSTGDLGGRITDALWRDGQVRALTRNGATLTDRWPGIETVEGDLTVPGSLRAACAGVHTIITTANAASRTAPDTIESVDVLGNANLIDAAEQAGVDRFVFVSTLGASPDHPLPLLRAKGLTERRLRASAMAWTIVQPDVFMDQLIPLVVGRPALANRPVPMVGSGRRRHSFVALQDVAGYAVAVLRDPRTHRQTIPVGGPDAVSWRDVVAAVGRVLGRRVPVQELSAGEPAPGLPPFVVQLLAAMDQYDSPVDMTGISTRYGVEPTSMETFVQSMVSAAPGSSTRPGHLDPSRA